MDSGRRVRPRNLAVPFWSLGGIVLAKPLLDFFSLGGQHDTLPSHSARALIVLSHNVRMLIQHLDSAAIFGSFELEGRENGVVFFHLLLE
jgi:hypothetical protein